MSDPGRAEKGRVFAVAQTSEAASVWKTEADSLLAPDQAFKWIQTGINED